MQDAILKTLLYFDIWRHPLTGREIYQYLPVNSVSYEEFIRQLASPHRRREIAEEQGYYYLRTSGPGVIAGRETREHHARKLWRMARLSMQLIRRFPFVRGVFVSGDLSKNSTTAGSDVDFFILTEPGRLWITRTLLILFKKVFLLNRKKYFCLNYFAATDHLELDERNIFLATEIATLKPLYNVPLFSRYLEANRWIRDFFPNFSADTAAPPGVCDRQSILQRFLEAIVQFFPADRIDTALLHAMRRVWERRYPDLDDATRRTIFRCTKTESRAYAGNFQEKILTLYRDRCRAHGLPA